jgi:hypothetical protein
MSLQLTQGDENHSDSPMMVLKGLNVVFDCAVTAPADEGFSQVDPLIWIALAALSPGLASHKR